ncbi:MAG: phosphate ABC transporter substrate-binding protein [Glaciecola sp.]|jgi:ABC-type phosphate transport system substrate-binding protein
MNPGNSITSISKGDLKKIFLGKSKVFTNGSPADPIDMSEGSTTRNAFYQDMIKRSPEKMKAYWAKQVFSGNGIPPHDVGNAADVKGWVKGNAAAIGYIDSADADDSVKVIPVN